MVVFYQVTDMEADWLPKERRRRILTDVAAIIFQFNYSKENKYYEKEIFVDFWNP